jgi:hypothetical protein
LMLSRRLWTFQAHWNHLIFRPDIRPGIVKFDHHSKLSNSEGNLDQEYVRSHMRRDW